LLRGRGARAYRAHRARATLIASRSQATAKK